MMSSTDYWCSSSSSSSSTPFSIGPSILINPDYVHEFGYPLPQEWKMGSPPADNMVFSSTALSYTDHSTPEMGWDHEDFECKDKRPFLVRLKSGKKHFVKKIFRKIDAKLSKNNNKMRNQTLQRSLSVGSARCPERFKVKTPAVIIGNPSPRRPQSGLK